ncbi:protein YIF1A-like [Conger conger]|uniref:protein YIF1A-like n=1 Tax=Conger conger TaxID=82655 RepID=UPI002A5B09FA|nr:protein YIF1A-like [Conger conger]
MGPTHLTAILDSFGFISQLHSVEFSPEELGLCASSALVWVVVEVLALALALFLLTMHSDLSTFDLLAPTADTNTWGAKPQPRLYITMATTAFQPIIIYWLTSHLVR